MKKLLSTALGALALAGCGPDLEDPGPAAQAQSQALEVVPTGVVRLSDQELLKNPAAALNAPEHRTFENTFPYDTGIKPGGNCRH